MVRLHCRQLLSHDFEGQVFTVMTSFSARGTVAVVSGGPAEAQARSLALGETREQHDTGKEHGCAWTGHSCIQGAGRETSAA
mmetsp:Transcript_4632/g.14539  ORF Transcript_4632/g.14539 Transcript_4632/m.14539 type:complete len:82 (+) Transcript_4632:1374-1619(+)